MKKHELNNGLHAWAKKDQFENAKRVSITVLRGNKDNFIQRKNATSLSTNDLIFFCNYIYHFNLVNLTLYIINFS